jgi:hypothetical protein
MDSEQWKQIDKLLHAVLEHAPEERDAFLRQACAGDERLDMSHLLAVDGDRGCP